MPAPLSLANLLRDDVRKYSGDHDYAGRYSYSDFGRPHNVPNDRPTGRDRNHDPDIESVRRGSDQCGDDQGRLAWQWDGHAFYAIIAARAQ